MFWKIVQRILIVPLAFILAAITATVVSITLGLEQLTQSLHNAADGTQASEMMLDVIIQTGALLPALTLIPALTIVIIGEVARIRSFLYYLVGGGAALAAIPLLARLATPIQDLATPQAMIWPIFATAGFAAGALYWLIAGRNA